LAPFSQSDIQGVVLNKPWTANTKPAVHATKGYPMDTASALTISRKSIAVRLLFSLLFLVIFELLKIIVVFSTLFQFLYLFVSGTYSQPLRRFCNKLSSYAYRILRFVTLNDNAKPFPFSEFSREMDPPIEEVVFDRN
jgi:hypothetical protein